MKLNGVRVAKNERRRWLTMYIKPKESTEYTAMLFPTTAVFSRGA
jgi:DNA anti-recombination protein RmuC